MLRLWLLFFTLFFLAYSYNNGLGRFPIMGWNTWGGKYEWGYNESILIDLVKGMKSLNMDKLGYEYVVLDDGWQTADRDAAGKLQVNSKKFPNGLGPLISFVHANGFKIGLYTDVGTLTCKKLAGSEGHFKIDAETFAEWEVDYIKVDSCHQTIWELLHVQEAYGNLSLALNQTGRPMVYAMCNQGLTGPWTWAASFAHQWRTTSDIQRGHFGNVLEHAYINGQLYDYSGEWHYNDPDYLVMDDVNNFVEKRSWYSLWTMMNSPLIFSHDVSYSKLKQLLLNGEFEAEADPVLGILMNDEVIAVSQDASFSQGRVVVETKRNIIEGQICLALSKENPCVWTQVWAKNLTNGRVAVLLLNHASMEEDVLPDVKFEHSSTIKFSWTDVGFTDPTKLKVRDLWQKKDLGIFQGGFVSPPLDQHDSMMLLLEKA